jgi:predicted nucleic acid-binding protein
MPVNYAVEAQVVDLRTDHPQPTDRFFVDTNVWFWTVYGRLGLAPAPAQPRPNQLRDYPAYLKAALTVGADIRWSGLSFSELAHRIEKTEFDIYCRTLAGAPPNPKEYRHNMAVERKRVMQEVELAWQAVEAMGKHLDKPVSIDGAATTAALQELKALALDGYDIFALQTARASGIAQVLSDDGDFCVVPGITLFTANRTVIAVAQARGKIVVR